MSGTKYKAVVCGVACVGTFACASFANDRVALVIGNAAYQHAPPLANPRNDAADMAGLLRRLGFAVTEGFDITEAAMRDLIKAFDRRAGTAKVALLFYSGHGMEVDGANYLLPVDAQLEASRDLRHEAIELDFVLESMGTGTNLVFLDACRDNPFARRWAGAKSVAVVGRGLAEVTEASASGMFIAFATHPGHTAADGEGRNSPFTAALKQNIETPGLEVNALLTEVRRTVLASTGDVQRPWANSSLSAAFYFVPPSSPGLEVAPQQPLVDAPDPAAETWMQIRATANAQMVERYLATYPNSPYRMAAEARLEELNRQPFTVAVRPSEAHVRILNSALPYQKGMLLPPGDYRIEATAEGYEAKVEVVAHGHSPTSHRLVLVPTDDFRDCEGCPEMVVIPAGVFRMDDLAGDGEPHEVRIADRFALSKYETTVAQFRRFVLATGYRTDAEQDTERGCFSSELEKEKWGWTARRSWQELEYPLEDEQPVVCVSWADARAYVRWLRDGTRLPYRLPSEAEWEYAARARSETMYHFGDDEKLLCKYGNVADKTRWPDGRTFDNAAACLDGNVYTTIVGLYRPNAFGLHDVVGNVWELMADCWNGSDESVPADGRAWETGDCESRVVRGGSWSSTPGFLRRSASRLEITTGRRDSDVGFRVARTLAP